MNTDTDSDVTEAMTTPAMSAGAFDDLRVLMRIVADERAASKRLQSLRAATLAMEKERTSLEAACAEHEAFVAKERQELAAEKTQLDERRRDLVQREGRLHAEQEIFARQRAFYDARRYKTHPSGMVQDMGMPEPPAAADPHFPEPDGDPYFVPAPGTSVTRTQHSVGYTRKASSQ
jgi:hypothetical protein